MATEKMRRAIGSRGATAALLREEGLSTEAIFRGFKGEAATDIAVELFIYEANVTAYNYARTATGLPVLTFQEYYCWTETDRHNERLVRVANIASCGYETDLAAKYGLKIVEVERVDGYRILHLQAASRSVSKPQGILKLSEKG